jgi:hypothetical protein
VFDGASQLSRFAPTAASRDRGGQCPPRSWASDRPRHCSSAQSGDSRRKCPEHLRITP